MSVEEGEKLAVQSIKSAAERDIGSGGKAIDVVIITKDGIQERTYELSKI